MEEIMSCCHLTIWKVPVSKPHQKWKFDRWNSLNALQICSFFGIWNHLVIHSDTTSVWVLYKDSPILTKTNISTFFIHHLSKYTGGFGSVMLLVGYILGTKFKISQHNPINAHVANFILKSGQWIMVFECISVVSCRFTCVPLLFKLIPLTFEMRNVNCEN